MLIEVKCNNFIKKTITFKKGLNVIVGDNNASNSIGKSTFLMILDFILGGETYLKHNKDVFNNIGKHEFCYAFKFNQKIFKYKKTIIDNQELIYECDENYTEIKEIDKIQYRDFLKKMYMIKSENITFREMISLYLRVWGKGNDTIKRPLHIVSTTKNSDAVNNLLKVYEKYDFIADLENKKDTLNKTNSVLNGSFREKFVLKINKKEYLENEKKLKELENMKSKIKETLQKKSINILNIQNTRLIELNNAKKEFTTQKGYIEKKIKDMQFKNLGKTNLSKNDFKKLEEFFPTINKEKILKIEDFHKKITSYLKKEIKITIEELQKKLSFIEIELNNINLKTEDINKELGNDSYLVEEITDITTEMNELKRKNSYYNKKIKVGKQIKDNEKEILDFKIEILDKLSGKLNREMVRVNNIVNSARPAPNLLINDKNYIFEVANNTGTGNGFENLIVFDLSIFHTTNLPTLIHDSFLFKNIEIDTMENIIKEYLTFKKQCFISIDELNRYSNETKELIKKNRILKLSSENVLFGVKWGEK